MPAVIPASTPTRNAIDGTSPSDHVDRSRSARTRAGSFSRFRRKPTAIDVPWAMKKTRTPRTWTKTIHGYQFTVEPSVARWRCRRSSSIQPSEINGRLPPHYTDGHGLLGAARDRGSGDLAGRQG